MENGTYISSLAWIHRGFAAKVPLEIGMNEEEVQELKADPMISEQFKSESMVEQLMEDEEGNLPNFAIGVNMNAQEDQYPHAIEDMQDDEREDYYIKDTDALIVAGKIEKQHSSLEIYVYEQEKNNLYIHHQIMLSAFPLSICWLNTSLESLSQAKHEKGNFAIVSSFLPEIEIWNLDVTEAVEPDLVLGGEITTNKKKPTNFKNKAKKWKQGSHTDAVLSLSLNSVNKSVLASGSADKFLKIWDLSKGRNVHSSKHHKQTINKVEWCTTDPSILFTASQDKTLSILDSRYPNDRITHKIINNQTISSGTWNVNQSSQIAYCTEEGGMYILDARMADKVVNGQGQAHKNSAVTDIKTWRKNLCFTCSDDETVRVWSLSDLSQPLAVKKPHCGKLYCLEVMDSYEGPVLSCGNANGELFVWDITENQQLDAYWKS